MRIVHGLCGLRQMCPRWRWWRPFDKAEAAQFKALLHKSLLLKRRRPLATFFELAMPLALVLLLCFIRAEYNDCCLHERGPYYFNSNPIYPAYRKIRSRGSTTRRHIANVNFEQTPDEGRRLAEGLITCGTNQYAPNCGECGSVPRLCGGDCIWHKDECKSYDDVEDRDDWKKTSLLPLCMLKIHYAESIPFSDMLGFDPVDFLLAPFSRVSQETASKVVTFASKMMQLWTELPMDGSLSDFSIGSLTDALRNEFDVDTEKLLVDIKEDVGKMMQVDVDGALAWFDTYVWNDAKQGLFNALWDKMKHSQVDASLPVWLVDMLQKNNLPTTTNALLAQIPEDVKDKAKIPDTSNLTWGELATSMYESWKDHETLKSAEDKMRDLLDQGGALNTRELLQKGQGLLAFLQDIAEGRNLDDFLEELEKRDKEELPRLFKDLREEVSQAAATIENLLAQTHNATSILDDLTRDVNTSRINEGGDYARRLVRALQAAEADAAAVILELLESGEKNGETWIAELEKALNETKDLTKTESERFKDFLDSHGVPEIVSASVKFMLSTSATFFHKVRKGAQWARIDDVLEKAINMTVDFEAIHSAQYENVSTVLKNEAEMNELRLKELQDWVIHELRVLLKDGDIACDEKLLEYNVRNANTLTEMRDYVKAAIASKNDGIDFYWGAKLHSWRQNEIVDVAGTTIETGAKSFFQSNLAFDSPEDLVHIFDTVMATMGHYADEDTMAFFGPPTDGRSTAASCVFYDALTKWGWFAWIKDTTRSWDDESNWSTAPPAWLHPVSSRRLRENTLKDELQRHLWKECKEIQSYMKRRLDSDETGDNDYANKGEEMRGSFGSMLHLRPDAELIYRKLDETTQPSQEREMEDIWAADQLEGFYVMEWALRMLEKESVVGIRDEQHRQASIAAIHASYEKFILNVLSSDGTYDGNAHYSALYWRQVRDKELVQVLGENGRLDEANIVVQRINVAEEEMELAWELPNTIASVHGSLTDGGSADPARNKTRDQKLMHIRSQMTWNEIGNKIFVVPDTAQTRNFVRVWVMEFTNSWFGTHRMHPFVATALVSFVQFTVLPQVTYWESEQQALNSFLNDPNAVRGIIAMEVHPEKNEYSASFRTHASFLPSSEKIIDKSAGRLGIPKSWKSSYEKYSIVQAQDSAYRAFHRLHARHLEDVKASGLVNSGVLNARANTWVRAANDEDLTLERMPAKRMQADFFIYAIAGILPMFMVLTWLYTVSLITKDLVYEKERSLRVVLRINGLSSRVYWLANLFSGTLLLCVVSVGMVLILIQGKVLRYVDSSLLLAFFALYSLATVSFANLMSAFFTRAKVASAVCGLAYYLIYLPYCVYAAYESTFTFSTKCLYSLLSSTALGIGSSIISEFEQYQTFLDWSTFTGRMPDNGRSGVQVDQSFNLCHVMGMLVVDSILYQFLAWYVEELRPGTYGVAKPWYFPFAALRRWYRGEDENADLIAGAQDAEVETRFECYERASDDSNVVVRMQHMHKIYPNKFHAIKDVSLDLHRGQIVSLLGPNGAGKSTTMALLTGLYGPTKGKIVWPSTEQGSRNRLGVCLQHDTLYDELTVQEHLRFFGTIKGALGKAELDALVEKVYQQIPQLRLKRDHYIKGLSGGMKRKLCLAIALCAESQVIVLDEPTSGIDAKSRRDIWDILIAARSSCAMLLSTHYMDEADALSNRVAFMLDGKLKALASPLTLKKHYSMGYTLTLFLSEDKCENTVERLREQVTSLCHGAFLKPNAQGLEVAFVLPERSRRSFAQLFSRLGDEKFRSQVGVNSFSLSAASLEEVFLHAAMDSDNWSNAEKCSRGTADGTASTCTHVGPNGLDDMDSMSTHTTMTDSTMTGTLAGMNSNNAAQVKKCMQDSSIVDCESLKAPDDVFQKHPVVHNKKIRFPWMSTVLALIVKRKLGVVRDPKAWVSQIILPAIFVMLALVFASLREVAVNLQPLPLSTRMFDKISPPHHTVYTDDAAGLPTSLSGDKIVSLGATWMGAEIYENRSSIVKNSFVSLSARDSMPVMFYQDRGYHSEPAAVDLSARIRAERMYKGAAVPSVATILHPLPKTASVMAQELFSNHQVFTDVMVGITLMLAMAFVPASFVVSIVHERHTKQKHLQMLTGVTTAQYWLSCYLWDMLNFSVSVSVMTIIFQLFQLDTFSSLQNTLAITAIMMLYATTMTPLMYVMSFLFNIPSTAYTSLICANVFTGCVSTLTVTTLQIYSQFVPSLIPAYEFTKTLFPWILPNFCLGHAVLAITRNHYIVKIFEMMGAPLSACEANPFQWHVTGHLLFRLAVMAPVWYLLVHLIDRRRTPQCCRRQSTQGVPTDVLPEDEDVRAELRESDRVLRGESEQPGLHMRFLRRVFMPSRLWWFWRKAESVKKRVVAVDNMTCVVKKGETFGLLGLNGAGKTTTMRMITGDEVASGGDAYVDGVSVGREFHRAKKNIGYCPQFDALPERLTCREVVVLFSALRGIVADKYTIADSLASMNLTHFTDTRVELLSGGNRRKLSTLVALLSSPAVVLLDEPSCGVDVVSRRFLWDILAKERAKGKALVLTTHSLEEAASTCTRLGIMIDGKLRCVGSAEYLKARHSEGYTLLVKTDNVAQALKFFAGVLPSDAKVVEEAVGYVRYHLPRASCDLATIFDVLQKAMTHSAESCIDDYAISNTTLEDVFLKFAREDADKHAADIVKIGGEVI